MSRAKFLDQNSRQKSQMNLSPILVCCVGLTGLLALTGCNFHNAGTVSGPTPEQGWSLDLGPQGEPPRAQPEEPDET